MSSLEEPVELAEAVTALFTTSSETALRERDLQRRISGMVDSFLTGREVAAETSPESLAQEFSDGRVPEAPTGLETYLDFLANAVVRHAIHTSSPRCLGHMTPAVPSVIRPLQHLVTSLNQNMVKVEASRSLSLCERQVLSMVHRLIYHRPDRFYQRHAQNGESTLGIVTSGGTLANLTALWCARNQALGPIAGFPGVERAGLPAALERHGYRGAVILGSHLMHYSITKAAALLGLGEHGVVKVATDRFGQVDLDALRAAIAQCRRSNQRIVAFVGIAGSTDSGSIDPLAEMADLARQAKAHFHVDAAWGGPLLFSAHHRHKLSGIDRADSVTIDGHKQLYLPVGLGMVILRQPGLARMIEKRADYILRPNSRDLGKRAVEGSRPGTALLLHAALSLLGRRGYEFLVDESIRKTRYMATAVRSRPDFQLLLEPDMNILLYRYVPAEWRGPLAQGQLGHDADQCISRVNERLQKAQRRAGRSFVSRTTLYMGPDRPNTPLVALRAVITNPATTQEDIDAVLEEQSSIGASLGA